MTEIHMPRLSDTMEEGVIAGWRKQVGEKVAKGDVVADIETDKAIMEMEAYDDGVLEKILVGDGETTPIGTPIALLGDGSGSTAEAAAEPAASGQSATEPAEPASEEVVGQSARAEGEQATAGHQVSGPSTAGGQRPRSSPLARAVARERGVDLTTVDGTGPGGRIIRADIEAAAQQQATPSTAPEAPAEQSSGAAAGQSASPSVGADAEEIALSRFRKVAAKRLTESKQQAPHFYLTSAVDVTDLVAFRGHLNERLQAAGDSKVSVNDLVMKACATALRANPTVNVSFAEDRILQHKRVNLGVAVAIDDGLVVPVIKDADRKSVSEIAAEGRELAGRAREGKLKPDEMSGGTFSVSNLGMYGIEQFSAVINPPEAAILAVGAVQDEVKVADGEFVARKIMRVTMSCDHRAVDGAVGAAFLQQLTNLLEDPIRVLA